MIIKNKIRGQWLTAAVPFKCTGIYVIIHKCVQRHIIFWKIKINGEDMSYFVYILECSDKTLYTGYTNDLNKRLNAHNSGKGAKYTKNRLPVKLIYSEEYEDKSKAMSREWHIKHDMTREEKLRLLDGDTQITK